MRIRKQPDYGGKVRLLYQPGQFILNGKYRIEALIGMGAFAEVYRATHLDLNTERAIKILRREANGIGTTEFSDYHFRFQLEAQLGNKLNHPNIIRVFDFEPDGDTFMLIMEYAQGGSLAQLIQSIREKGESLPVEMVVRMGIDVASGLSAMHQVDAIHRDIKPSNILFDNQGHAKIADLGLAQVPGGPSLRSKLSQPLPHPGTPGYMSPEQANSNNYLTPASDIFSLGSVLFEALTGRIYANQKPGTRVRSLRPELPKYLDNLIASMLSEIPRERPWDGAECEELLMKDLPAKYRKHARDHPVYEISEESKQKKQVKQPEAVENKKPQKLNEQVKGAEKDKIQVTPDGKIIEEIKQDKTRKSYLSRHKTQVGIGGVAVVAVLGFFMFALRPNGPWAPPPNPEKTASFIRSVIKQRTETLILPSETPKFFTAAASLTPTQKILPSLTSRPNEIKAQVTKFTYILYGPGNNFRAMLSINPGDQVTIIGRGQDYRWLIVKLGDGRTGYIPRNCLDERPEFDDLNIIVDPPTPTLAPTLSPTIARFTSIQYPSGDINHDCVVDQTDYDLLISAYGTNDPSCDLNGDGTVDLYDYNILVGNFGTTCP
jgi:serine/threonine protein kinase